MESTFARVAIGHDLGAQISHINWDRTVVFTQEIPWKVVNEHARIHPAQLSYVKETGIQYLRSLQPLENVDAVVGIGGGASLDCAKYMGWIHKLPVIAIPTIASADAMVTPAIAVRTGSIVRYIGSCAPGQVIVCCPIIQSAPARLNRAGISDILSCQIAQFDWRLAADREKDVHDSRIAESAWEVFTKIVSLSREIRSVSEEGITALIEAFSTINDLCADWGNARMEEGSEHFFAYNMEYLTKRHFVHGELVALGILLMAILQDNQPEKILDVLNDAGVEYRPEKIGTDYDEISACLATLPDFVRDSRLWYSIIDEAVIEPANLIKKFRRLIGNDG